VTYLAHWHDPIGRNVATADYGTNSSSAGNEELTRPATIPASSDTVLVTRMRYNDRGEVEETTDPAGIVNRTEFDHAGRQVKTIQNYVSGGSQPDQNITVEMTYTADGNLKTLTAKNPTTGDQTTTYEYGADLVDDYIAASNLLIAEAYPDLAFTTDKVRYKYNRQGEAFSIKDQRASDRQFDFDKAGRVIHDRVMNLGLGGVGPVRRISRTYDVRGLLATVTSYSDQLPGSGTVLNQVQLTYNGLGQLLSDQQEHTGAVLAGSPKVQYTYRDGANNLFGRSTIVYPDGKTFTYDYGAATTDDYGGEKVSGTVFMLFRPSLRAKGRFQSQLTHCVIGPGLVPVRRASLNAASQRLQLGWALRRIHMVDPTGLARQWPRGQQRLVGDRAAQPTRQAAPGPVFGAANQVGAEGIPLGVAGHRVVMLVRLDRKRLEPALIDMPRACRMAMRVPALRVGQSQPADKPRQLAVFLRPKQHVPVIGQNAVGQQPGIIAFDCFGEHFFQGFVVGVALEDRHPRVSAVEHMINVSRFGGSKWAPHAASWYSAVAFGSRIGS
jgi:hypothetical protein